VAVSKGAALIAGRPLALPAPPAHDGRHLLLLRPERLRIMTGAPAAGVNALEGRVSDVIYQGDSTLLQVELAGGARVGVRGNSAVDTPRPGDPVTLGLRAEDTFLLPDGDR
jgi:putative spermidine/putrescine transport system ATP-binding protein